MVACATAPSATEMAEQLRQPGRLDHTIELKPPSSQDRSSLLGAILDSKKAVCGSQEIEVIPPAHAYEAQPTYCSGATSAKYSRQGLGLLHCEGQPELKAGHCGTHLQAFGHLPEMCCLIETNDNRQGDSRHDRACMRQI